MTKPVPIIYNKSVWEVTHKVGQSLRMGQIFTVTEAQPTITDVVFDDGSNQQYGNKTCCLFIAHTSEVWERTH